MRTLCVTGYGLNIRKKLKFLNIPHTSIGLDDVFIKIKSASLNPVDYKIVYGMALLIHKLKPPFPIGFDMAGIVIKTGKNVSNFNIGDEVYSKVPWEQMGTITPFAAINAEMLAIKPKNISFSEAAGIPLVGCTVIDSFKVADIKKGTKILIHAGSGGIGSFAIQYAKYLGAYVITTTSTSNTEWVKQLGADEVIDYKKRNYLELVRDADVVYDTLGGKYTYNALRVVKKDGKIISIAGHHDDATLKKLGVHPFIRFLFLIKGSLLMLKMKRKGVFYKHVWTYPTGEKLDYIRGLIENGHIKPIIDKEFNFEEAIDAFKYLQSKRAKGKVIIKIDKEI